MDEIIRNIRKDCRQAMNGIVSTSMREYGLDYKLNFGLVGLQIKALAEKYGPSAQLAEALWKEATRELKILSTLVYPTEEFSKEVADRWVREIPNQEIREQICLNLLQELPNAVDLAKEWVADVNKEVRTTGYWLLGRLMLSKKLQGGLSAESLGDYLWQDVISEDLFLRNGSSLVLKQLSRFSKEEANLILSHISSYKEDSDPLKNAIYQDVVFEKELFHS